MAEPVIYASLGPQGGGYELKVRLDEFRDYSQSPPHYYSEFVLETRWDDLEGVSAQVGGTQMHAEPFMSNVKNVLYTRPKSPGLHLYHIGLATHGLAPS